MSDRKVSTDALETLGTIIDEHEKRDAIHLAVFPAQAKEKLFPGQDIGLVDGEISSTAANKIAIVDPFLTSPVFPDQWFWAVIYPRKITSLRHVWTHPDIDDEPAEEEGREAARKTLQRWATDAGVTLVEILQYADEHIASGEYRIEGGRWEGFWVDDSFWNAYEIYTGRTVDSNDRGGIFSCSC